MRIAAGDVSRHLYFVAVDAADLKTRRTSLTHPAVWYSRDGGAKTVLSNPLPEHLADGVFKLALDQAGMVAAAGDCCELVLHITADEMAPVTRVVEIVAQTEKDAFDRLGAPAGASLAADVAAVEAVADAIQAKTANLPTQPAAVGSRMDLVDAPNSVALGAIADAVLDEEVQSAEAAGTNLRAAAKAAWAQGFGRWVLSGTTLTLYGPDGSTPVRAFTLNDAESPTARTPV